MLNISTFKILLGDFKITKSDYATLSDYATMVGIQKSTCKTVLTTVH